MRECYGGNEMGIVESLSKLIENENGKYNYVYRLTKCDFQFQIEHNESMIQSYGIEVERQVIVDEHIVNIERDYVKNISPQRHKVHSLLKMLYDYEVSPIHLIDILGEYIDEYITDFDEYLRETYTC